MLMADLLDYLFVAQYIVDAKQILDDGNNLIWQQKPTRHLTASQAKHQASGGVEPMCAQRQSIPFHEKHSWLPTILPAYFL